MEKMNKILESRLKKGISATQLSDLTGISKTSISLYENGKKTPSILSYYKIANALGVAVDILMDKDNTECCNGGCNCKCLVEEQENE